MAWNNQLILRNTHLKQLAVSFNNVIAKTIKNALRYNHVA